MIGQLKHTCQHKHGNMHQQLPLLFHTRVMCKICHSGACGVALLSSSLLYLRVIYINTILWPITIAHGMYLHGKTELPSGSWLFVLAIRSLKQNHRYSRGHKVGQKSTTKTEKLGGYQFPLGTPASKTLTSWLAITIQYRQLQIAMCKGRL